SDHLIFDVSCCASCEPGTTYTKIVRRHFCADCNEMSANPLRIAAIKICNLRPRCWCISPVILLPNKDAWISRGRLEDRQIAKIHHQAECLCIQQQLAQWFAIAGTEPLIGGNKRSDAT